MANIKSQEKRIITNEKARLANKAKTSRIATEIRKFRSLIAEAKFDEAGKQLQTITSLIDRARLDNVYHINTASRKISALTLELNKAKNVK